MIISTNSTPQTTAFSTEIKHNNATHAVINANTSLNNNALNNIRSILPPALTTLLSETIEYNLDFPADNSSNTLQNKKNVYLFAAHGALNDIKNGNREIENGAKNIIDGKINKVPALIKKGEALVEKGKALRDNGQTNLARLLSDKNPPPVAKSYYLSRNALLPTAQQFTQQQQTLAENNYNSLIVMFNDIQQTIRDANKSYLHCYRDIFKNSMEKFQAISGSLSDVSNYVSESSQDNFITLKQQKMLEDLRQLHAKLSQEPDGISQEPDGISQEPDGIIYQQEIKFIKLAEGDYQKVGDNSGVHYTETQALALMKSYRQTFEQKVTGTLIEAPDLAKINEESLTTGITIKIKIDPKPLARVIQVVENLQEKATDNLQISQARFNLINTAIDTTKKDYQAMLDEMSQRYNTANANYDNFVKILSSTINAMQDSAKSFLR
ncbi:IpaD/SipD/SspD family type III secretion system needle tip protein [Arsenophonus apicola]|uniref:IpaD/SipD/SspD family type III secretion system needle tip protein n=1 Tax=Arsenophonus apicola TaxID=2879119 RepID=A0ABY8P478_9GAMM|nr:IpaD/SipD/SspD family type III secretion system needle tip protein [Arsenophonus apicola]WGO83844.1 IpaD/SipD/SspD family type III secretion system needle tip protein [Arsenophonus apicola]